ncbi:MAG TPA: 3-deoxy-8-phosphooctulonate synthase [Desulfobacteraceae bacterium]|nr:3-deoxy-8-phosphooctulonate synthase [Desulfobacteraceae bacterium]
MDHEVTLGGVRLHRGGPFFLIAGPCVIESEELTLRVAEAVREMSENLDVPVIFKSSYDKANRTSIRSYRGPGVERGLEILAAVKEKTGLPVISDVHWPQEVAAAAGVLDVLQIPAFLCRQTDLLTSAAASGKPVNIKKGQFLSPWEMKHAVEKVYAAGNGGLMLTERGASFGYNNLVVDMRSIAVMGGFGCPVVFDATHSVQLPGGADGCSAGQREFAGCLARAAVAAGADGVFIEVHPDPDAALCDGANSLPLKDLQALVGLLKEIHGLVSS